VAVAVGAMTVLLLVAQVVLAVQALLLLDTQHKEKQMAHFAELDENDVVLRVLVVPDNQEHRGHEFLSTDLGLGGTWVQTSYNGTIRKNYAGQDMTFDRKRDAFIAPKPFDSWLLNEETCRWESPVPYPTDDLMYEWDETITDWKAIVNG
jgi:hypothetical protein